MPVLYFNYHIGGLVVSISPGENGFSLFSFLIRLCAIIGGTYTIANFLDNFLHKFFD
jgi:hypothetical protein